MVGPFLQALAFLTRLPVPHRSLSERDWQRSPAYYPLVGVVIGLLLWAAGAGFLLLFSDWLAAVLVLVFWVFLTGGLHLDGWMDVADGLGSHRSPEQMREIMKDSRVGAMGVLAAVLLFLVKWVSIRELIGAHAPVWLLFSPWIARLVLLAALRFWPYTSVGGLGEGLVKGNHLGKAFVAHLLFVGVFVSLWAKSGGLLVALGLAVVAGIGWVSWICRKLEGMTGDSYGATVEWTETAVLLLILAMERWI
ncbi:cobalamin 5'-phosphate synthase [Ammoniphilus oxalaticus]|uniref:Adenosylcobinamide-GDP ribazoletransferase n=1 Tax=Ammoniphilus oxalaticus TaxID=66863 RepID=A0A419SLS9_9BACL|nr:adenosylcobinamide-GDP ribazoletransferase [Ammoniphilus oxalaticus]RKD24942.1 cobalamin 5'-phosphate synthase [Ammoniphilus oxalaticus]